MLMVPEKNIIENMQQKLACIKIAALLAIMWGMISPLPSFAQAQYTNQVYRPYIKSVEFYNTQKKPSFPVITINSTEKAELDFDDLTGGSRNFYYTIEHCDENWNSSNLSSTEYLQGFNDDRITDYSYSSGTIQKYTHYSIKLPNQNISPKIPGNYILKVYEDGDQSKMVLTQRLYVLNTKISTIAEIVPSNDNALRQTNQKINFTIDYGSLRVQNPSSDIRTQIMQNGQTGTTVVTTQPAIIRGNQLIYNDYSTNDFPGRNEFRHFDTRTLKLNSDRVLRIIRDTANTVVLLTDPVLNQPNYSFLYDNDGNFYVGNSDGSDPHTDADYAHIIFSLAVKKSANEGSVYVVGQFNNYRINDNSKLAYDASKNLFFTSLLLKQGVYDYKYVWISGNNGKPDDITFEGSHFETENDYQMLVYYHPAGARWTELVGYRAINSVKK